MNLLSIEWMKVRRYRTFWILLSSFVALLVLWNWLTKTGLMQIGPPGINILSQAYSFPEVWGNVSFYASVFVLFVGMIVVILTTNEYQFRTNRQNVIDGWQRLQFYHAKWLVVILLSLITTVVSFLLSAILGFSTNGSLAGFTGGLASIGYLFILTLNYCGFALTLSVLMRRSGLAIGIFLLYSMLIETILHGVMNGHYKLEYDALFLPLQCSDHLLPFPLMAMAENLSRSGKPAASHDSWYLAASCIWIAMYYLLGRRRLLRSDW